VAPEAQNGFQLSSDPEHEVLPHAARLRVKERYLILPLYL